MNLYDWGWDDFFEKQNIYLSDNNLEPGRVVFESRHLYKVETNFGIVNAIVSGHFIHNALKRSEYPTVGDWVGVRIEDDIAVIEKLLDRKSSFSRKSAGVESQEQVIASNMDYLFIVFALEGGRNFTPGAVERYITQAWDSGVSPIIILNKTDLCLNPMDYLLETESLAPGVPVHLTSTVTGSGLNELTQYLIKGKTVGFTGFSGVGKSALINSICGIDLMKTGDIRQKDLKGMHTTTHKELLLIDGGGILIDTPGLKELQLWGSADSLNNSFEDIYELSKLCKFRDCSHDKEPGCAVKGAIEIGELKLRRFNNYLDMKKELKYLETKTSLTANLEEKAKWKAISKEIKKITK